MTSNNMLEIRTTKDRGKIVVASQKLDPGTYGLEIIREDGLLIPPTLKPFSLRMGLYDVPSGLEEVLARYSRSPQIWLDYKDYKQQPLEVQAKVMSFFYDQEWEDELCRDIERLPSCSELDIDWDEFSKLAMIFKFNSFSFREENSVKWHGLFDIACRFSHSCKANCNWIPLETKQMSIRLITPVEEGEELTLDYFSMLVRPTKERQAVLQESKKFLCQCLRCTNPSGDDCRRFPCQVDKACPGVHFASCFESEQLLDCTVCENSASVCDVKALLHYESVTLPRELKEIQSSYDQLGLTDELDYKIRSLQPPHAMHHLALEVYTWQGDLDDCDSNWQPCVKAYKARVSCLDGILGTKYPNFETGKSCGSLGDVLQHTSLKDALATYQRAVQIFQIMEGVDGPNFKVTVDKLLSVQRRLVSSRDIEFSKQHCALCGAPAKNKCSRCKGQVVYCCREHQVLHWRKIHRKRCEPV